VTRHGHRQHAVDEPNTYDELIQLWQSFDEPLTRAELLELWNPRTPHIIVVARWVVAVVVVTILVCLPTLLRAVGGSLL
jgi:hypothetical protein